MSIATGPIDDAWVRAIDASQDYRLLRRLDVREGRTDVGRRDGTSIAVVIDTETTGVGEDDVVVELAMRRIRFDPDGVIVAMDKPYSWLEDPGRALPEDVAKLTGLTDDELRGRSIDDGLAMAILSSAEFVCAHNARFDRGMLLGPAPGMVDPASVAAFAAAFCTSAQLGDIISLTPRAALAACRARGLRPVFGPPACRQAVWSRSSVVVAFGKGGDGAG